MGEYQLIYTAIGAIVFVAAIIGGRFFIVSNFASAEIQAQTTTRELNAMSISYNLLDCLKQDGDSVQIEFLEQNAGKNICDLCGICEIIGEAKVTDLESDPKKEWEFKYILAGLAKDLRDKLSIWKGSESQHKTYSLYLNIDNNGDSHIGRLDVNV